MSSPFIAALVGVLLLGEAHSAPPRAVPPTPAATAQQAQPEQRLLAILQLLEKSAWSQAHDAARQLTQDHPDFLLAQLVYGDLLLARSRPLAAFGAVPAPLTPPASNPVQLEDLRAEARQRLEAIRHPAPLGKIPRQFIEIPSGTQYAIAVDVSKSRLYLFKNLGQQLQLVSEHYISVGRSGTEKQIEGDQRTPLGIYFVTHRLEQHQIDPHLGIGALPLNYPNEYDRRLGKTGGGIWLHGVPQSLYARPPQATDGCIALTNSELSGLLSKAQPRRTPVVITPRIDWVDPQALDQDRQDIHVLLEQWRQARISRHPTAMQALYSQQFQSGDQDLEQWLERLASKSASPSPSRGATTAITLKNISILTWKYRSEVMVINFTLREQRANRTETQELRQYWGKENGQWRIFFEGIVG